LDFHQQIGKPEIILQLDVLSKHHLLMDGKRIPSRILHLMGNRTLPSYTLLQVL
jgi:hypothetical protein